MRRGVEGLLIAGLLSGFGSLAVAQSADPTAVVDAGLKVVQLIDAGKAEEVWDGASAVAKKLAAREAFVQAVTSARQPLGAVQSREWSSVVRQSSTGTAQLPAGSYVNVKYSVHFANGHDATELVSFRFDDDKTWRVTGYFLQ